MPNYPTVGTIRGITIKGDLTLPIGNWPKDNIHLLNLSRFINALDTYLKCNLMRLDELTIVHDRAQKGE